MKGIAKEFFLRGLVAMGFGPIVLAVIYFILGKAGVIVSLTADDVALGFISITLMAFVAGGINVVYKIEGLPLFYAILLHGVVLYIDYILIYVLNGWIESGIVPIMIFSVIFVVGYALIWLVIFLATRRSCDELNKNLVNKK